MNALGQRWRHTHKQHPQQLKITTLEYKAGIILAFTQCHQQKNKTCLSVCLFLTTLHCLQHLVLKPICSH